MRTRLEDMAVAELGRDRDDNGETDDFGFWLGEGGYSVIEACAIAFKEHGILPQPGGLLDQDDRLMSDIYTWLAEYSKARKVISDA